MSKANDRLNQKLQDADPDVMTVQNLRKLTPEEQGDYLVYGTIAVKKGRSVFDLPPRYEGKSRKLYV
jgi:hypothetical protein